MIVSQGHIDVLMLYDVCQCMSRIVYRRLYYVHVRVMSVVSVTVFIL
jgi:hypothetical protein